MGGISTAQLAAAVAEAGGLGMLGIGSRGIDVLTAWIDDVLALTSRPVGVGFINEFLDRDAVALAVERLPVIEFYWGWPDPELVADGRIVGWQVGSVDEARAAIDAGCAYVAVQGIEAGGHVRGNVELDELLASTRIALGHDAVIVAGGGVGTAADVRRLLDQGADAVRVGTRFVAATESAAHDRYVELLTEATDSDTELSEAFWLGWPEAQHRVLTSAVEASGEGDDVVGSMPGPDGRRVRVPRFFVSPPTRDFDGFIDAMALYAGTGSTGAVDGRVAAADVVAELTIGLDDA